MKYYVKVINMGTDEREVEKCISCGKDTIYMIDTPIDMRDNYVEGGGQLCTQCHIEIYGE